MPSRVLPDSNNLKYLVISQLKSKCMGRPSKFDPIFKAKVAVEALQEKEPLAVLAKMYHEVPL